MKKLSIISPVYNEEGNVEPFYDSLKITLKNINLEKEIVFINDGSTDKTYTLLNEIASKDKSVKIINFSRNFGHQAAITAGLDYVSGDVAVILDSDLQDPSDVIIELVKKWEEGYEVVNAKRSSRQDGTFKVLTAKMFYRVLNTLITYKLPENVGDFRLLDRAVIDTLKKLPEKDRYLRGLSVWVGYKQAIVEYDRKARIHGETHYPLSKMFGLAFDAIFSFSKLPMRLALLTAFIFMIVSIIVLAYALFSVFLGHVVAGWASTLFIISFLSSLQMLVLSVVLEYVGRIYTQTQGRPIYIVATTKNF